VMVTSLSSWLKEAACAAAGALSETNCRAKRQARVADAQRPTIFVIFTAIGTP
jgi:hypothetical protein